jgi:hypothetical protein
MRVNVQLLHAELAAAGLPVTGVWYNSRPWQQYGIIYARELTRDEQASEAAVLEAHNPDASAKVIQENARVSDSDMLSALWDKIANNDPKKLDTVKVALASVKPVPIGVPGDEEPLEGG